MMLKRQYHGGAGCEESVMGDMEGGDGPSSSTTHPEEEGGGGDERDGWGIGGEGGWVIMT